jgi:hypothetical protein
MELEFKPWPKIARFSQNQIVVTEKIDGTNACVVIKDKNIIACQSRNNFITPENDNMGFARWAWGNEEELVKLGEGHHFGEWAGPGIQKNPHNLLEKTFFLFNVFRPIESIPEIVKRVPILYQGSYSDKVIEETMLSLLKRSKEEKYTPEGIIIYFMNTRTYMKHTFRNTEGKWKNQE